MRFRFIDRITKLEPGRHIEAVKHLSGAERYLDDHFPKLPLMPGVLMLEAMYQAGLWLVRQTENFTHSVVLLNEARNVKFSGLVQPGQSLMVTADIEKQEGDRTILAAQGMVDGKVVVSGRLVMEAFQLADRYPLRTDTDDYLLREVRKQFGRVLSGTPEHPTSPGPSMRWMWLDRFVEFVRGQRAVAIKNVSLAEEPLSDYLPGFPVLPCSLIVEGLAWTGGILANDQRGFRERTVLAKVNRAVFHRPALPGDQLRYTAVLEAIEAEAHSSAERATSATSCRPKWTCSWRTSPSGSKVSKAIWSIPPRCWPWCARSGCMTWGVHHGRTSGCRGETAGGGTQGPGHRHVIGRQQSHLLNGDLIQFAKVVRLRHVLPDEQSVQVFSWKAHGLRHVCIVADSRPPKWPL